MSAIFPNSNIREIQYSNVLGMQGDPGDAVGMQRNAVGTQLGCREMHGGCRPCVRMHGNAWGCSKVDAGGCRGGAVWPSHHQPSQQQTKLAAAKADYSRPRQTMADRSIAISTVLPASPMHFQLYRFWSGIFVSLNSAQLHSHSKNATQGRV